MQEYLYVCLFSNRQVKVGRSSSPKNRIASHADRVSCMGVTLEASHIAECVGNVVLAEAELINKCRGICSQQYANEWFLGVDYQIACEIASECAYKYHAKSEADTWSDYVKQIMSAGYSQVAIASAIGCSQPSIAYISSGRTVEPSFNVGYRLLVLGRSLGISDPSFLEVMEQL